MDDASPLQETEQGTEQGETKVSDTRVLHTRGSHIHDVNHSEIGSGAGTVQRISQKQIAFLMTA